MEIDQAHPQERKQPDGSVVSCVVPDGEVCSDLVSFPSTPHLPFCSPSFSFTYIPCLCFHSVGYVPYTPLPLHIPPLQILTNTSRCKMPNVDQDTGLRHPAEPDRSLRKHREVDAGAKNKGCLGMQLTPLFGDYDSNSNIKMPKKPLPTEALETWIEVGSSVEVLSWGEHVYIAQ